MRIIQTSDKSLGKHFLLLGDDNKSLSLTTPTLIFKQKLEDIIEFIKNYSRQNLGTPLFSHDLTGDTFKIKIPSRYSNFSTTFFNANKEVISYGELKDKCRIKILMETSGIWSNSRCTSFYFHAKEVLTDLRN